MKYKILKRIQDGTANSGYQLVSEDNNICEMDDREEEYRRTYRLLSSTYSNRDPDDHRLYAEGCPMRDCAEIEMNKRGMLW